MSRYRNNYNSEKKRSRIKWIILVASFVMTVIMFGAFVNGMITERSSRTTDTLSASDYSIGTIDGTSGKILESKKNAYTKDMYKLEGVKISLNDEIATVTYKVAYYDEEGKFLSMSNELTASYDAEAPEGAVYFRVLVTPYQVDGEDVTLTLFNKSKYVNQLEVTFGA